MISGPTFGGISPKYVSIFSLLNWDVISPKPSAASPIVSRHIWRLTFVVTNSTTSQAPPPRCSAIPAACPCSLWHLCQNTPNCLKILFPASICRSLISVFQRARFSNTNNLSPKGVTWHFGKPNIIHRHGKKGVKTGKKFPQIRHFPSTRSKSAFNWFCL